MPIYSYRCETCGFQQDVLRKMSDPLLVTCPSCGASTFQKQVTAAGFQLKGSGWYVTDFRNPAAKEGSKAATTSEGESGGSNSGDAAADAKPSAPSDGNAPTKPVPVAGDARSESKAESKPDSKSASKSDPKAAKPAAPPAGGTS